MTYTNTNTNTNAGTQTSTADEQTAKKETKPRKPKTLEQQLALLEQKAQAIKERMNKQKTNEKIIVGGAMLAYARSDKQNARFLLEILTKNLREQDKARVTDLLAELKELSTQSLT